MFKFLEPPRKVNILLPGTKEEALSDLAYLWKCDDPEWMAQREADWVMLERTSYGDYPKAEKRTIEEYFKYGRLKERLPGWSLVFLTPYNSTKSLVRFFNSKLLDAHDRRLVLSGYAFGFDQFESCYWYKSHLNLIVEEFLGGYCEIVESAGNNHVDVISPSPSKWCRLFVSKSIESLQEERCWMPFYSCVNYFVTALPYAEDNKQRKQIVLDKLFCVLEEKLASTQLSGQLLCFAQELQGCEEMVREAWRVGEQNIAALGEDR